MARRVTQTDKDEDGDILALCNPNSLWKRREKWDAIDDIEQGTYDYYVEEDGDEVDVLVKGTGDDRYLTTAADESEENNLDNLPDCEE